MDERWNVKEEDKICSNVQEEEKEMEEQIIMLFARGL